MRAPTDAAPGTPAPAGSPSVAVWLALVAMAVTLVFTLYGRALGGGFCCDDGQILFHAASHAPWRYFADPDAWRALIPGSLTPWLGLRTA